MKRYKIEAFERLVDAFSAFPSIGLKSAQRLAYFAVMEESYAAVKLAHALEAAVGSVRRCARCHNMSEDELCAICCDESRDRRKLCMVQSAKDILYIEESGRFDGRYYVLERIEDMDEAHLFAAVKGVEEVIFAFPPSLATETMMLYIEEKLKDKALKFSKIAQGVPTGVALENIDTLSLARAIEDRVEV